MRLSFVTALPAALLLAAPATASIKLGEQFFRKDWAAACDNVFSCEAVSLLAEDAAERTPTIVLSRDSSAAGAVSIKLSLVEPKGDRYRILIDGRAIDSGTLVKGEYPIHLTGTQALKLARAIARGRKLTVRGSGGELLGELALNGSAAALGHIDAVQNRAGTRSALFAIGRKAAKPKSAPMPVIVARRIGKQEMVPDTTAIVGLVEGSACAGARSGVTEDTAYSLGRQDGTYRALVLVNCGSGAYNLSAAPYVGSSSDGKKWTFAPARFDFAERAEPAADGVTLLVNPSWDADNQQVSSYAKGRGLGDCGAAETYVWDGAMFRLVLAYAMGECRGSTEWLTLWRAKVEFRG